MKKPKASVKIELTFTTRRDFLALKNAVAYALDKAHGSFFGFQPLRKLMDRIEEQAKVQD